MRARSTWCLGLALAAAACVAHAQPTLPDELDDALAPARIAFLVANENYAHVSRLESVAADLPLMRAALENAGFEIVATYPDASYDDLAAKLPEDIETRLSALAPGERALVAVYYGGHAGTEDAAPYLVPTDFCPFETTAMHERAVPLVSLASVLDDDARVAGAWFLLDACRTPLDVVPHDPAAPAGTCGANATVASLPAGFVEGATVAWDLGFEIGFLYSTSGGTVASAPNDPSPSVFVRELDTGLRRVGEPSDRVWRGVQLGVRGATAGTRRPMAPEVTNGAVFYPVHDDASRAEERAMWERAFVTQFVCFFAQVDPLSGYYTMAVKHLEATGERCPGVNAPFDAVTGGAEFRVLAMESAPEVEPMPMPIPPPPPPPPSEATPEAPVPRSAERSIVLRAQLPRALVRGDDPVQRVELGSNVFRYVRRSGQVQIREIRQGDLPEALEAVVQGADKNWKAVSVCKGSDGVQSARCDDAVTARVDAVIDEARTRDAPVQVAIIQGVRAAPGGDAAMQREAVRQAIDLKYELMQQGLPAERIEVTVVPNTGTQVGEMLTAPPDGATYIRVGGDTP